MLSPVSITGPNNSTLRVHNPNQDKLDAPKLGRTFSYVLWVTRDGGSNYPARPRRNEYEWAGALEYDDARSTRSPSVHWSSWPLTAASAH